MPTRTAVFALMVLAGCLDDVPEGRMPLPPSYPTNPDILAVLQKVPGLTVTHTYRYDSLHRTIIELSFTQPVDHEQPNGETFEQRAYLWHSATDRPTMFRPLGYALKEDDFSCEMCEWMDMNVLTVEHRYYGESLPDAEFRDLTVRQAAEDHHRFVEALRSVYASTWLSTGSSKGGVTALAHRMYFPDDVDGTIAYVAPLMSAADDRFDAFFDKIGTKGCREQLLTFQNTLLKKRAELIRHNRNFFLRLLPGVVEYDETVLEERVLEFPFGFWKSASAIACDYLPSPTASIEQLSTAINEGTLEIKPDADSAAVAKQTDRAFVYQSARELGFPKYPDAQLRPLLKHVTGDPRTWIDGNYDKFSFDDRFFKEMDQWARNDATRVMLIYGENDPFSAAPVPLGLDDEARDNHSYTAPNGNHGSQVLDLSELQGLELDAILADWTLQSPNPARFRKYRGYELFGD